MPSWELLNLCFKNHWAALNSLFFTRCLGSRECIGEQENGDNEWSAEKFIKCARSEIWLKQKTNEAWNTLWKLSSLYYLLSVLRITFEKLWHWKIGKSNNAYISQCTQIHYFCNTCFDFEWLRELTMSDEWTFYLLPIYTKMYIYILLLEKEGRERKYRNDLASSMHSNQNIVKITYMWFYQKIRFIA